jgi:hypothetical protein
LEAQDLYPWLHFLARAGLPEKCLIDRLQSVSSVHQSEMIARKVDPGWVTSILAGLRHDSLGWEQHAYRFLHIEVRGQVKQK